MRTAITAKVLGLVAQERLRQDVRFGRLPGAWDDALAVKLAVLGEEVGEVSRAVLDDKGLVAELVQVAAVAVAWVEAIVASPDAPEFSQAGMVWRLRVDVAARWSVVHLPTGKAILAGLDAEEAAVLVELLCAHYPAVATFDPQHACWVPLLAFWAQLVTRV